MRIPLRPEIPVLFFGIALSLLSAQSASHPTGTSNSTRQTTSGNHRRNPDRALSPDDGMAVIAAALDSKALRYSERDCSHLVHAIYERAGFPYAYVDSDDLYDGVEGFRRVTRLQPGDLIVWRGHAGIVVRPSRHVFFSFLSAGPGTDNYEARYWVGRGQPRFYRYVKKDPCPGCNPASATLQRTPDAR
jgi:cell wall-associated NlpC family hydrolase